jgi:hypothetical protein
VLPDGKLSYQNLNLGIEFWRAWEWKIFMALWNILGSFGACFPVLVPMLYQEISGNPAHNFSHFPQQKDIGSSIT